MCYRAGPQDREVRRRVSARCSGLLRRFRAGLELISENNPRTVWNRFPADQAEPELFQDPSACGIFSDDVRVQSEGAEGLMQIGEAATLRIESRFPGPNQRAGAGKTGRRRRASLRLPGSRRCRRTARPFWMAKILGKDSDAWAWSNWERRVFDSA